MKNINIISKVVSRGKAEALPSASASMPNWAELAKYVTIDGDENINGLKNFTKGLQIGGLPLTKLQDDVVYLDAHLVVRGGITMFGTGEDVDVPTMMDALSVDGVNLQVINGVLTFVGEATGGVADSVRWENVIGRPTLLSSFTDDVVAGKYLPLSGGTISGTEALPITISNNINDGVFQVGIRLLNPNKTNTNGNTNGSAQFGYSKSNGVYMFNYDNYNYYNCAIGITDDGIAYVGKGGAIDTKYKIWHEGNDGSGSGLDADLLDGLDSGAFFQSKGRFWSTYINSVLGNGAFWTADYTPVTGVNAYTYGTVLNFRADGRQTQFYITDGQQKKGIGGRIFFRDSWNAQETMSARWLEIITDENIGSQAVSKANQLTTARTIWGQSFDGTGNVSGDIDLLSVKIGRYKKLSSANDASILSWKGKDGGYLGYIGYYTDHFIFCNHKGGVENSGISAYDDGKIEFFSNNGGKTLMILPNGNVGIGIDSPSFKLDIKGGVSAQSYYGYNGNTNTSSSYRWAIYQWNNELQITRRDSSNTHKGTMAGFDLASGNVLFEAGITMYSDQRKKTILNHVELSLKQIADAPLIEHYYNSDDSKTTHVGSIAQYWASLNDWFCKEDNEGFYTMEIQNAALASAISIARELVKYESKTDKKIRLLKKRIGELENKIEELKKKGV